MKQVHTSAAIWQGKCPACGKGDLFQGYLKIAEQCNHCGLSFKEHDCGDGPIFFVMSILCLTITPAAVALELIYQPPIWLHLILWPALCFFLSIWLLKRFRGLFTVQKYKHLSLES